MRCLITYTSSTEKEDFKGMGADGVFADLSGVYLEQVLAFFSTTASASICESSEERVPVLSGWSPHSMRTK
jgi:hypothetical protein